LPEKSAEEIRNDRQVFIGLINGVLIGGVLSGVGWIPGELECDYNLLCGTRRRGGGRFDRGNDYEAGVMDEWAERKASEYEQE